MARLQAAKRYPGEARLNQQQGVAYVRISLSRAGAVLSASLDRGSGVASLDAEALALAARISPLPAPPPELPGNPVILSVPIRFNLR